MAKGTKRRPSWLSGGEPSTDVPNSRPPAGTKDPSTNSGNRPRHGTPTGGHLEDTVARVSLPGGSKVGAARGGGMGTRLRANPGPVLAVALLVLMAPALAFVFFPHGEDPVDEGLEPARRGGAAAADPFAPGSVRDTGVLFGALREEGGEAELDGAGLSWSGTVAEGEAGETVTLEGPTAAQLERGFDLGPSSVETGVYAVAQDGGEVLHVATHGFLPEDEAREMTLGTVYALRNGELDGYAYYLDRRERGSDRVTRTYVRPGAASYSVSFEAPARTPVPLLVGWRGFGGAGEGGE